MANNVATNPMVHSILDCARCGGNHDHLTFEPLLKPITVGNITFNWWAPCPYTQQPLLCAYINGDTELVITDATP